VRDIAPVDARPPQALADLHAGATTPTHPYRWPVLSTVAADGGPDSRVVVLRRFDPDSRLLVFHTDVRTPKVADLRRDTRCGWLFYDPDDRLQLRVRALADVHHADPFARREFDALPPMTRASYASVGVPGDEEGIDAPFDYPPKPPVDEAVAFGHFAAVACVIERADVLELHPTGHRRAVFEWPNGEVRMRRVGP
jgi:pyridoxamine 5'-phosphate oxidase